jgi:hypothetical protein
MILFDHTCAKTTHKIEIILLYIKYFHLAKRTRTKYRLLSTFNAYIP